MATQVKTLRLPLDVVELVESFPGDNFSAKFIVTARMMGSQRKTLEADIALLERRKQRLLQDVSDLQTLDAKKRNIAALLGDIHYRLSRCRDEVTTYQDCVTRVIGSDTKSKE